MSMIMMKSLAIGLAAPFLESKYGPSLGEGSMGLPKLFGVTPALLTGMSFWVLMHGFAVVGSARSKYIKLAKEAGEKDVDERYGLPNLYAQGTSKFVTAFNCIQRSHQHILETFPQLCLVSMIGAVHYPLATAVTLSTYCVGRISMSTSYASAEGDASKRYSSSFAVLNWYGFITTIVVALVSSASFIAGKPIL